MEAEQSGGRAGGARLEGARGSLIPPGSSSSRVLVGGSGFVLQRALGTPGCTAGQRGDAAAGLGAELSAPRSHVSELLRQSHVVLPSSSYPSGVAGGTELGGWQWRDILTSR